MLRVTLPNGESLHSVALGSGSTARANITPVSQLIVARLTGGDPADFFTSFGASAASAVSNESVQAAVVAVVETLKNAGIDLSAIDGVLTGELVAATAGGAQGNAFDQMLDALGVALENGSTTLAQLTETIAQSSPVAVQTPNTGPTLPAELLLKTAAANCPALRSGTYRMLTPMEELPESRAITFSFDASTLSAAFSDGDSTNLVADGPCKYRWTDNGGEVRAVVSPAGVGVLTTDFGGTSPYRVVLFFPEQKASVADLAGTWNTIEWEREDVAQDFSALMAEVTVNAEGHVTELKDCVGPEFDACAVDEAEAPHRFAAHPAGGFSLLADGMSESDTRMFAYRAGSGDAMLAVVDSTGTLVLATKKRVLPMNPVGTVSANWSALVRKDGVTVDARSSGTPLAGEFSEGSFTVTAIDTPEPGSFVRGDGTVEQTLKINTPRDGLTRRIGATGVSPIIMMNLRGMGVTAGTRVTTDPTQGFYLLSIAKAQ